MLYGSPSHPYFTMQNAHPAAPEAVQNPPKIKQKQPLKRGSRQASSAIVRPTTNHPQHQNSVILSEPSNALRRFWAQPSIQPRVESPGLSKSA
jgi:hypothetical protein